MPLALIDLWQMQRVQILTSPSQLNIGHSNHYSATPQRLGSTKLFIALHIMTCQVPTRLKTDEINTGVLKNFSTTTNLAALPGSCRAFQGKAEVLTTEALPMVRKNLSKPK